MTCQGVSLARGGPDLTKSRYQGPRAGSWLFMDSLLLTVCMLPGGNLLSASKQGRERRRLGTR